MDSVQTKAIYSSDCEAVGSSRRDEQSPTDCAAVCNNIIFNKFSHLSGIYRNGKLMHTGSNNNRNTFNGRCICYSTHAEMDVIQKVLKGAARTAI
jgi:hypothetical protein